MMLVNAAVAATSMSPPACDSHASPARNRCEPLPSGQYLPGVGARPARSPRESRRRSRAVVQFDRTLVIVNYEPHAVQGVPECSGVQLQLAVVEMLVDPADLVST